MSVFLERIRDIISLLFFFVNTSAIFALQKFQMLLPVVYLPQKTPCIKKIAGAVRKLLNSLKYYLPGFAQPLSFFNFN